MMSGILSPAFLQAAGRAGKGAPVGEIELVSLTADPTIESITGTDVIVTTTKNGQPHTETYASLEGDTLSISADENTKITITGTVTEIEIGENAYFMSIKATNTALTQLSCSSCYALQSLDLSKNTALTQLSCSSCYALQSLDLSKNTALMELNCSSCYTLQSLDLSKNTALTQLSCNSCYALQSLDLSENTALTGLNCSNCYALQSLDLSENTALTQLSCSSCYALQSLDLSENTALMGLNCSGCAKLVSIFYPATNSNVSTAIANAITDATAADGTVYTDSAGAYYSTIETAANDKGWTIEQLS